MDEPDVNLGFENMGGGHMPIALSFRAAAARAGVTHAAIGKAVRAGRIPLQGDGTLEPDDVDTWSRGRRALRGGKHREVSTTRGLDARPEGIQSPGKKPGVVSKAAPAHLEPAYRGDLPRLTPELEAAALARALVDGGLYPNRPEAELARDSYVARLRELEYREKSGALLPKDQVVAAVAKATGACRNRLLAIPAEQAPALHRCKGPAELQDVLQGAITAALDELTVRLGNGL